MEPMRKMNVRFPKDTLVKLDEVLALDNSGKDSWQRKSRGQLIREMVDQILERRWKPPLFTDQPDRPVSEPAKKRNRRRQVNHTKTPAAKKYLKHMRRKKFARA